jgi:hypothetical protein
MEVAAFRQFRFSIHTNILKWQHRNRYIDIYIYTYMYTVYIYLYIDIFVYATLSNGKSNTEFNLPFAHHANGSLLFVYEETNGNYPLTNRLN